MEGKEKLNNGTYRGKYKPKEKNVKKLQIFLNSQKNES
jgi:hypothetical protein